MGSTLSIVGSAGTLPVSDTSPGPSDSFTSSIQSLGLTIAWILQGTQEWDLSEIAKYARSNSCILVSDGSYAHPIGTASVTIWTGRTHWFIFIIPGLPENQSAYCSEADEIYAQLWFWKLFQCYFSIPISQVTIGCNEASALSQVFSMQCTPSTNHLDMISGTQHVVATTPDITFMPRHVLGHQDKNPWNTLDLLTTMNVAWDEAAVEY